jgi:serine/threonine protein kinase
MGGKTSLMAPRNFSPNRICAITKGWPISQLSRLPIYWIWPRRSAWLLLAKLPIQFFPSRETFVLRFHHHLRLCLFFISFFSPLRVQTCAGMVYLNSRVTTFVHRDLAARNLLVNETRQGLLEIKICDFGLSRVEKFVFPSVDR